MVDVRSRAHRILKPMLRFRDFSDGSESSSTLPGGPILSASEEAIGIYANDESGRLDDILFTTEGLYLQGDQSWLRVFYADMDRTVPPSSKKEVTGLGILLRDGTEIWLPVRGSTDGKFYDAFEILRFLDRVVDDMARR